MRCDGEEHDKPAPTTAACTNARVPHPQHLFLQQQRAASSASVRLLLQCPPAQTMRRTVRTRGKRVTHGRMRASACPGRSRPRRFLADNASDQRSPEQYTRAAAQPAQPHQVNLFAHASEVACLADNLAGGGVDALAVHEARGRVGALGAAEEQDVGLRAVDGVVHPAAALLHAEATPLGLREQAALGRVLRDVLRQDHMAAWSGHEERRSARAWHGKIKARVVILVWRMHRYSKSSS